MAKERRRKLPKRLQKTRSKKEPAFDAEQLERINTLARGARGAWLSLLSLVAFVGVTLLGVEDADFFLTEQQTQLPLVGVSIPTLLFFVLAPTLTLTLYGHLHFHLMKLWEAVAGPVAKRGDVHLSDKLGHSFIVDMALAIRGDGALRPRPSNGLSRFFTFMLVFAAVPLVLGFFWFRSMPAHKEGLTIIACGIPLFTSLLIGGMSYFRLRSLVRKAVGHWYFSRMNKWLFQPLLFLAIALLGFLTTEGTTEKYFASPTIGTEALLYPANLAGVAFVETPLDWELDEPAKRTFARRWCGDNSMPARLCDLDYAGEDIAYLTSQRQAWCNGNLDDPTHCEAFFTHFDTRLEENWEAERRSQIAALPSRDLSGSDLRGANLFEAQLQGADLLWTQLQGADLIEAQLQGADLFRAQLQGADLFRAQMQGADLFAAQLQWANLFEARLQGANLRMARLGENTDLTAASLRGAAVRSVDDTTIAQLRPFWQDIFADGSVQLPAGETRPDHWAVSELGFNDFDENWRAWRATLPPE